MTSAGGAADTGTVVTPAGSGFTITGGTQAGFNLFHSFDEFSLPTGVDATFTDAPPAIPIDVILSRVVGGSVSDLDGVITVDSGAYPGASFFFINPAGVVMRENFRFNGAGGDLHISTARQLEMANGILWSTDGTGDNTLTSAAPAAFGFLGANPSGDLTIDTTDGVFGTLNLIPQNEDVSFTANNVSIVGDAQTSASDDLDFVLISGTGSTAAIAAMGVGDNSFDLAGLAPASAATGTYSQTDIHLQASLGAGSDFNFYAGDVFVTSTFGGGAFTDSSIETWADYSDISIFASDDIFIGGGTAIRTPGPVAGGDIFISSTGDLTLDRGAIYTSLNGVGGTAGDITVDVAGAVTLDHTGNITTSIFPASISGTSGDLTLYAGSLALNNNAGLRTINQAQGDSGDLVVVVDGLVSLAGGSAITTHKPMGAPVGAAGSISFSAGELSMTGGSSIAASGFTGGAGEVAVDVDGSAFLDGASLITASASAGGNGGPISFSSNSLAMNGQSRITTITQGGGDGGAVTVTITNAAVLEGGARVESMATQGGSGADLTFNAGSLTIFGGPNIPIPGLNAKFGGLFSGGFGGNAASTAGTLTVNVGGAVVLDDSAQINSVMAPGQSGAIFINAGSLSLITSGAGGGLVADGAANAAAGDIFVSLTGDLAIHGSAISARTNVGGLGAGDITVSANNILIDQGGRVDSSTLATTAAGNTTITAGGNILLTNNSVLTSGTVAAGAAANLSLSAGGAVTLDSNSSLYADSRDSGTGAGGNLTIDADTLSVLNGATLNAGVNGPNDAGTISITTTGLALFDDNNSTFTPIWGATRGSGRAANLVINAGSLSLTNGAEFNLSSVSPTFNPDPLTPISGDGGDVFLNVAGLLSLANGSRITAASTSGGSGAAGSMTINAGALSMSGASQILTQGAGAGASGSIAIDVDGGADLIGASIVNTGGTTGANGGLIAFAADVLNMLGASRITSNTQGGGDAGAIAVSVDGAALFDGGSRVEALGLGGGDGGDVTFDAGALTIFGGPIIPNFNVVFGGLFSGGFGGSGTAGTMTVDVEGAIALNDSAQINAIMGGGQSGSITLDAGSLSITNTGAGGGLLTEGAANSLAGDISVSLSGDLAIHGGAISTRANTGALGGGDITITAHNILLDQAGRIDSSSLGTSAAAGSIAIDASQLTAHGGAFLDASTFGPANGGSITVGTTGAVLIDGASYVASNTSGAGRGGVVSVTADSLTLDGTGSRIASGALDDGAGHVGTGGGGDIFLDILNALSVINNSFVLSGSPATTSGQAGDISVQAGSITLGNAGRISSSNSGSGDSGDITVAVDGQLSLNGGSLLAHKNFGSPFGNAGSIDITAGSLPILNGTIITWNASGGASGDITAAIAGDITMNSTGAITGLASSAFNGNQAGDITITAHNLIATNNTVVGADSGSAASAGQISITLSGLLDLSGGAHVSAFGFGPGTGDGGDITIAANAASIVNSPNMGGGGPFIGTGLLAYSDLGDAGTVTLTVADDVFMDQGGRIDVSTRGPGLGGNIAVLAGGDILIANNSILNAQTLGSGAAGNLVLTSSGAITLDSNSSLYVDVRDAGTGAGGNLTIDADTLSVLNGATLNAGVVGPNDAGTISITTAGQALFDDNNSTFVPIWGATNGGGRAADLIITAGALALTNGAEFNLGSYSPTSDPLTPISGNGGDVQLNIAGLLSLANGSLITTSGTSTGTGAAGSMTINAGALDMSGTSVISARGAGAGHGGNIAVDIAGAAALSGESVVDSGAAGGANAGLIMFIADVLTMNNASRITSLVNGGGDAGDIAVTVDGAATLDGGSRVEAMGFGGGDGADLTFNAGSLTIFGGPIIPDFNAAFGGLYTAGIGAGAGGVMTINVDGAIALNDSAQLNAIMGGGQSGSIALNAASLSITNTGFGGGLLADAGAVGSAGDISVSLSNDLTIHGGFVTARTGVGGTGDAGDIMVSARNISMDQAARIDSSTRGSGAGGNTTITAIRDAQLTGGSILTTQTLGSGAAGNLSLTAFRNITLDTGSGLYADSRDAATGAGGNMTIGGNTLSVLNGASLNAGVVGPNDAGTITITTAGEALFDSNNQSTIDIWGGSQGGGRAANLFINAGKLTLDDGAEFNVSAMGAGGAGQATFNVANLMSLDHGSSIHAGASGGGAGAVPGIDITANKLTLANASNLFTASSGSAGAGDVDITTGGLTELTGGSSIFAFTSGTGPGGDITITANKLSMTGGNVASGSLVAGSDIGTGGGGDIVLNIAGALTLDGAGVSSNVQSATAAGDAGNIQISAGSLSVLNNGLINTNNVGLGDAGDVFVVVENAATLSNSGRILALKPVGAGLGDAGDITFSARSLTTSGGTIGAWNFGAGGSGGDIVLVIERDISLDGVGTGSAISSSVGIAGSGDAGDITITARSITATNNAAIGADAVTATRVGSAGSINITLERDLVLTGDARVTSSAIVGNTGTAGDIVIIARGITLDDTLNVGGGGPAFETGIFALSEGGAGGNITLSLAQDLTMAQGALINASGGGNSDAGDITVTARNVTMTSVGPDATTPTAILSQTAGAGDAGTIRFYLEKNFSACETGGFSCLVSVDATGSGDAGFIGIDAGKNILLGAAADLTARTSAGSGRSGAVWLFGDKITVDGSLISIDSGEAGAVVGTPSIPAMSQTIFLWANTIKLKNGADLSADNVAGGDDGRIILHTGGGSWTF